jgi:hypothetical protein
MQDKIKWIKPPIKLRGTLEEILQLTNDIDNGLYAVSKVAEETIKERIDSFISLKPAPKDLQIYLFDIIKELTKDALYWINTHPNIVQYIDNELFWNDMDTPQEIASNFGWLVSGGKYLTLSDRRFLISMPLNFLYKLEKVADLFTFYNPNKYLVWNKKQACFIIFENEGNPSLFLFKTPAVAYSIQMYYNIANGKTKDVAKHLAPYLDIEPTTLSTAIGRKNIINKGVNYAEEARQWLEEILDKHPCPYLTKI